MAGPYATKAEILAFIQTFDSTFTLAQIPDAWLAAATEIIEKRTREWGITSDPQYINGRGEDFVYSPICPIASLTGVIIIHPDTTEETLDISGTDREIWYNAATGLIKRISSSDDISRYPDGQSQGPLFPEGVQNIKLTGTFGNGPYNILNLLQTMLVFQMLRQLYPEKFSGGDKIMEKIGEYEYRLTDMQYSNDPKNQRKTLEGYIEWLFDQLPMDEYTDMVLAI